MTTAAILGLGEAGAIYARGLRDAGYEVSGHDPFTTLDEAGIAQHGELAEALDGAELVISLVGARAAADVARAALPLLSPGAVYADLNTAAPQLKAELGAAAESRGALFADVAVLAPVPRAGIRTPLMASGPGAAALRALLERAGAPVEAIDGPPGDAAARKLLRSVFMKGLAAVVIESLSAAEAAGCAPWLRGQIVSELSGGGADAAGADAAGSDAADANRAGDAVRAEALVERLLTGSVRHAARRMHEAADAADYLASLDRPNRVALAARDWFEDLQDSQRPRDTPLP